MHNRPNDIVSADPYQLSPKWIILPALTSLERTGAGSQNRLGTHFMSEGKPTILLVSIVPPRIDCRVRIVMHRHLMEWSAFELRIPSNADFDDGLLVHTRLREPHRIR